MKKNKEKQRQVSTCFDGSPCAEMMQKIMGKEGIGSLCERLMRSLSGGHDEGSEEPRKAKKEGDDEKDEYAASPGCPRPGQEPDKKGE